MHIKTRLSFQFTFIVAGILIFFSILVYYFSYQSQLNKFHESLLQKAQNTAILLINVSEVDSVLLKKIHQSTFSLEDEEIAITDSKLNLIYSNNIKYLYKKLMKMYIDEEDVVYFSFLEKDGVYFKHIFNGKAYHVFVLANDKSRDENLLGLREILFWSILISVWLSVLFAYIFSRKAINPISKIISSVKQINSAKLNQRLDEGNKKDEIAQLAITFNEMLSNLEIAFRNQEDFIAYASHEMRTPLTIMIAESDYIIDSDKAKSEYREHISGIIVDLKKLNTLLNSLLELAHLNSDKNIVFSTVRIDEIIFSVIHQVKSKYKGRKILPKINYPENGEDLFVNGDEGLLSIAFKNLIDNACKFSDKEVIVEFIISNKLINVIVSDSGIGIPREELENIYKPFKRANNVKFISGYGIGLTLVYKILDLHGVKLDVTSTENEGTSFVCTFRRFNYKE